MKGMRPNRPFRNTYPDAFLGIVEKTALEITRNVQAPVASVCMLLLNALAMACQGLIDVKLPTGQIRPTVLFFLMVIESGGGKTTIRNLVLKMFLEADARAYASHQSKMEQYQAELDTWQAKHKGLCRAVSKTISKGEPTKSLDEQLTQHALSKPKKPVLNLFLHESTTAKALMEATQGDGVSKGVSTDEGNVLFQSPAMSNWGLMNRFFDGPELLTLDRVGEQISVVNPRVSVCIMTQSAPLLAYLEKHGSMARGSGHWARYLVGWPQMMQGYRQIQTSEPVWEYLPAFHARTRDLIDKYQSMIESGKVEREIIEFSEDAKARWFSLAVETENLLRQGAYLSDISDFASKIMEILARVTAVMHYFNGESGKITLDTLERAFRIVHWHMEEFKFLFSPEFMLPQAHIDAQAVLQYLRDRYWLGVFSDSYAPKNEVLNKGPLRGDGAAARLKAALDVLIMHEAIQVGPGSNPKDRKIYIRLMNQFFATIPPSTPTY